MVNKENPSDTLPERRKLVAGPLGRGDKWFFRSTSIAANFAFVLVGLILVFLFISAWPALQSQGINFVFGSKWSVEDGSKAVMQLGPMLWGSIQIAIIGIALASPMAIATAYLIVFILPKRAAKVATAMIDLLAALPSVVIGLWGVLVFTPVAVHWAKIANQAFGWIPIFAVKDPTQVLSDSPFIAGWTVAVMIVPIITSVTREIFTQLDDALVNGALALGASRFSVLRRVILPTSAPGIIGGILLGMGRAIGETVAILYVLQLSFNINWYSILEPRGGAVASWILARFGEANKTEFQGLMAAGLVLFVVTLLVNVLANVIVNRSKAKR
jgi:phosphate transport system permease protein